MNIILASGSPRRKKLLEHINLSFTVEKSDADEHYDASEPPEDIVRQLALRKATEVVQNKRGECLVIGADTIVIFKNKILEKPKSKQDAFGMLSSLSGDTHQVYTGVALLKTDKQGNIEKKDTFFERTDVTFGVLDHNEIQRYIKTGLPLDKAGAYGIQDSQGSLFVKKINGDYYNVVGFPLHAFYQALKNWLPDGTLMNHSLRK